MRSSAAARPQWPPGVRMGRRRRLLLLWALLGLLHPGAPEAQSVQHTFENVKLLQISMRPTAVVQVLSKEEENPKDQDGSNLAEDANAKEEEKTLNDLVGILQDMVKDIPTAKAEHPVDTLPLPTVPLPTKAPEVMTSILESSQTEAVNTVWVGVGSAPQEEGGETSDTVVLANQITPASPAPIWEVQNGKSEPVVLITDDSTTAKPLVSVSLFQEKATTKKRTESLDQMTNGALSSLEQSLENVKKLNGILDTFSKTPAGQGSTDGKGHQKKPTADDILGLIEKLIETLKNTPSFVKEDRNLYKYIQTAETYIKEALDLTGKAEKALRQENPVSPSTPPPVQEETVALGPAPEPLPVPVPTVTVQSISPPPVPLAKKAEDAQVEMGKLKAFINLLYGFSPHLTTYTEKTADKKVAEDIVQRALAVLHAIKSVFCGSEEAQSKQALKQLLKEDMELVNQAVKAKRVS